ncbi:MAG: hypothetical protein LBI43_04920 [Streptococcaceae bacterium]|nr:hypothetical protein [Streptococcaceae bacterium]
MPRKKQAITFKNVLKKGLTISLAVLAGGTPVLASYRRPEIEAGIEYLQSMPHSKSGDAIIEQILHDFEEQLAAEQNFETVVALDESELETRHRSASNAALAAADGAETQSLDESNAQDNSEEGIKQDLPDFHEFTREEKIDFLWELPAIQAYIATINPTDMQDFDFFNLIFADLTLETIPGEDEESTQQKIHLSFTIENFNSEEIDALLSGIATVDNADNGHLGSFGRHTKSDILHMLGSLRTSGSLAAVNDVAYRTQNNAFNAPSFASLVAQIRKQYGNQMADLLLNEGRRFYSHFAEGAQNIGHLEGHGTTSDLIVLVPELANYSRHIKLMLDEEENLVPLALTRAQIMEIDQSISEDMLEAIQNTPGEYLTINFTAEGLERAGVQMTPFWQELVSGASLGLEFSGYFARDVIVDRIIAEGYENYMSESNAGRGNVSGTTISLGNWLTNWFPFILDNDTDLADLTVDNYRTKLSSSSDVIGNITSAGSARTLLNALFNNTTLRASYVHDYENTVNTAQWGDTLSSITLVGSLAAYNDSMTTANSRIPLLNEDGTRSNIFPGSVGPLPSGGRRPAGDEPQDAMLFMTLTRNHGTNDTSQWRWQKYTVNVSEVENHLYNFVSYSTQVQEQFEMAFGTSLMLEATADEIEPPLLTVPPIGIYPNPDETEGDEPSSVEPPIGELPEGDLEEDDYVLGSAPEADEAPVTGDTVAAEEEPEDEAEPSPELLADEEHPETAEKTPTDEKEEALPLLGDNDMLQGIAGGTLAVGALAGLLAASKKKKRRSKL